MNPIFPFNLPPETVREIGNRSMGMLIEKLGNPKILCIFSTIIQ